MLPKRHSTYLLTFLLILLAALVAWIFLALDSPELQQAAKRQHQPTIRQPQTAAVQPLPSGTVPTSSASPLAIDSEHQKLADALHSEESSPQHDLEIVQDFLILYGKGYQGGLPTGDNADITAALTGTQYPGQKGHVFPRQHRAVRNGQLVDRWGEPFWFHPNSGSSMEIRSSGPDKQLFSPDDIVLNPSPGGFGATPPGAPEIPQ